MKTSVLLITSAMLALTASPALASNFDPASNDGDNSVELTAKLASVITNANLPTIESADSGLVASIKMVAGQSTISFEELTVRATTDTDFVSNLKAVAIRHSAAVNKLYDDVIESFVETGQSGTVELITALVSGHPEQLAQVMSTQVADNIVSIRGGAWQNTKTKAA